MADENGQAVSNSTQSGVAALRRLAHFLRYVAPVVFFEELVRGVAGVIAPKLAAKLCVIIGKLCCVGLLVFGYSGDLPSECVPVHSLTELGMVISNRELTTFIFNAALGAEVFFGALLLYRMRSEPASRFIYALRAWTLLCVGYYLMALCYGADRFVHVAVKETTFIAMSAILVDLADQALRLRAATRVALYASAVLVAATTMVPWCGPFWPMALTSIYGVFAAFLAGWAWKDRLSAVELTFWLIYVVSLLYRVQAYDAGPDELVIYYALMNSKWVTLNACCGSRVKATAAPAGARPRAFAAYRNAPSLANP